MHSGADVEAFTAALNRDIESDSYSADLSQESNHTSSQLFPRWQTSSLDKNTSCQSQQDGKGSQKQEQHSYVTELKQLGSGSENGALSPIHYLKQEPIDQANEQQQKSQSATPHGLSSLSLVQVKKGSVVSESLNDESFEMQSSRMGFSTSTIIVPSSSIFSSMTTQMDSNTSLSSRLPSATSSVKPLSNAKTPLKKPTICKKKPLESLGSSPPLSSKKQKVSGTFLDQSIEQLNDVTTVSGVNIREEGEHIFSGPKEDSRVSEASHRVVQGKERLILRKIPLQKKLTETMAKCGRKSTSNDIERCLLLPEGNIRLEGDNEKDDSRSRSVKANKEEDYKMRTTAANVAVRVAVGGDDVLSKWQLMAEQARQKCEGWVGAASSSQPGKDVSCKFVSTSVRNARDNQETEKRSRSASGATSAALCQGSNHTSSQLFPRRQISSLDLSQQDGKGSQKQEQHSSRMELKQHGSGFQLQKIDTSQELNCLPMQQKQSHDNFLQQQIEQNILHISQTMNMQNSEKNPAVRSQKMSNQQAGATGQANNALKSSKQVPSKMLLPVIEPLLDNDRAMLMPAVSAKQFSASQTAQAMNVPKFEKQNTFSEPKRVQGGTLSQLTNHSTSQQNSVHWQSSTSKEQKNGALSSSIHCVQQEPIDQANDQQQKSQLHTTHGLYYVSPVQVEQGNAVSGGLSDVSFEMQASRMGFSHSILSSVTAQMDSNTLVVFLDRLCSFDDSIVCSTSCGL